MVACDALLLLGAALILLAARQRGRPLPAWLALAFAGGCVVLGVHVVRNHGDADTLLTGSGWLGALACGIGAANIDRRSFVFRASVALLVALVAAQAAKGALQVLVEHPHTVEHYRQNREAILAANGWSPDSAAARLYERRLLQSEATGWVGMANVYATTAAWGLVAFAGLLIAGRVRRAIIPGWSPVMTALVLGLLASAGALVMCGAKGGFGAAIVGLACLCAAWWWRRRVAQGSTTETAAPRWAYAVGPVLVFGVLGAVVARLLAGDAFEELSIRFRGFYLTGAASILFEHPLLGVGPSGFKDAYQQVKPVLSPEEPTSPHSVLADYAAGLGLPGLMCWGGIFLVLASRIGAGLFAGVGESAVGGVQPLRPAMRTVFLALGLAIVAGAYTEVSIGSPEAIIARLISLAGGCFFAWGVLRLWNAAGNLFPMTLCAAGMAVVVHAQIELTPIHTGSAPWCFLAIGLAAAGARSDAAQRPASRAAQLCVLGPAVCFAALLGLLFAAAPLPRWEGALRRAHAYTMAVPELMTRAEALERGRPWPGDTPASFSAEVSRAVGFGVDQRPASWRSAILQLRAQRAEAAAAELQGAATAMPRHFPTARARQTVRLEGVLRDAATGRQGPAREAMSSILQDAIDFAERNRTPGAWGWVGTLGKSAAGWDAQRADFWMNLAIEGWLKGAERAPQEQLFAAELARAFKQRGDGANAREWAARALEIDHNLRLDPAKGLTEDQRRDMQELAAGADPDGTRSRP